jgi:hypothetical protein
LVGILKCFKPYGKIPEIHQNPIFTRYSKLRILDLITCIQKFEVLLPVANVIKKENFQKEFKFESETLELDFCCSKHCRAIIDVL